MSDSTPLPNGNQYVVYILQVDSGAVKIGISNDIARRLIQVQTGNHELVTLVYSFVCISSEQALAIEQALHAKYRQQHIRGEWYSTDPQNIIADIEFASQFVSAVTGIQVEYVEQIEEKPRYAPTTRRIKLTDVAQSVYENGDEHLSVGEMVMKYGISMGATTKVREMARSMNGKHKQEVDSEGR